MEEEFKKDNATLETVCPHLALKTAGAPYWCTHLVEYWDNNGWGKCIKCAVVITIRKHGWPERLPGAMAGDELIMDDEPKNLRKRINQLEDETKELCWAETLLQDKKRQITAEAENVVGEWGVRRNKTFQYAWQLDLIEDLLLALAENGFAHKVDSAQKLMYLHKKSKGVE